jgi:hypothetical protein
MKVVNIVEKKHRRQSLDCARFVGINMSKVKFISTYFLTLSKKKYDSLRCRYDLRYKVLICNFAIMMQYCKCRFITFDCPDCCCRG